MKAEEHECRACGGKGYIYHHGYRYHMTPREPCVACKATGTCPGGMFLQHRIATNDDKQPMVTKTTCATCGKLLTEDELEVTQ